MPVSIERRGSSECGPFDVNSSGMPSSGRDRERGIAAVDDVDLCE